MLDFTNLILVLKKIPKVPRIIVIVLLCAALAVGSVFALSGCSTIRVVGNAGNSKVQVQQHALDSMQISVQFLPLTK